MEKRDKSLIAVIAFILCFVMLFPSSAFGQLLNSQNVVTFSSDGITIYMDSSLNQIDMNGHSYTATWDIYAIGSTGFQKENFTNYGISRIDNAYQNSVVRTEWNQNVQVGQIFSFGNGYVDASVAIKNLRNGTSTYDATFVLASGHSGRVNTLGYDPSSFKIPLTSTTTIGRINSTAWGVDENFFSLSWQNEMSLFHSGMLEATPSNNIVSIPFGPFSLLHNETYTIDPVISSNSVTTSGVSSSSTGLLSEFISPDCIVCICTTCGGGGGGSGSPPGGSTIVGVSPNVMMPGGSITVTAHANSVGSGGVYLHLDVYNLTNGQWDNNIASVSVGSSTSNFNIVWSDGQGGTSKYDWSAVRVYASNSYGSGSVSSSWNVYSETYLPASIQELFSVNGTQIGGIANSISMQNMLDSTGSASLPDPTAMAAIFVPEQNSNYAVHSINQSITWVRGSDSSIDPSFGLDTAAGIQIASYFQNVTNNNASQATSTVLSALSIALSVAAIIATDGLGYALLSVAIGALAIVGANDGNAVTMAHSSGTPNYFYYESAAGVTGPDPYLCGRIGAPYCSNQYGILGVGSTPSYIYDVGANLYYGSSTGGTQSQPYIGVLQYISTFTISQGPYYNSLYGTSYTMYYTMGGYT